MPDEKVAPLAEAADSAAHEGSKTVREFCSEKKVPRGVALLVCKKLKADAVVSVSQFEKVLTEVRSGRL